jgi:hypothetical protein
MLPLQFANDPLTKVYFTTDRSEPNESTGSLYTGSLICRQSGDYQFSFITTRVGYADSCISTTRPLRVIPSNEAAAQIRFEEATPAQQACGSDLLGAQNTPGSGSAGPWTPSEGGEGGSTVCGGDGADDRSPAHDGSQVTFPGPQSPPSNPPVFAAASEQRADKQVIMERISGHMLAEQMHLSLKQAAKHFEICT